MVKSVKEVLGTGKSLLTKNNIDTREARLLLAHAMEIDSSDIVKMDSCSEREEALFLTYLERRISGEPYAYIVGYKEFMKLKFLVNKNVLIPREDTEVLVLEAIKQCKEHILDLCTGSGCIAISLAKYIQGSKVDAVDICTKALTVAKKNASLNDTTVGFIKSDLFENVTDKYDMIVSNPPYIKTSDLKKLQVEVRSEPKKALDGGKTGLDFYKKIILQARDYLNDKGMLLLEIGYDQASDVMNLLKEFNYKKIKKIKDLSNNDRVIIAERG